MADIKTFTAIRPKQELVAQIAALPYDVYNRAEAREAVQGHPHTFLRIDRPETQFSENCDMYAPEVYEKAARLLQDMIADGRYVQDTDEAYYIYQLIMDGRTQNGIVACASIDDYVSGVIKKHENTREEKEQDRIRHVDTLGAQTGPIFLAYRSKDILNQLIRAVTAEQVLYSFTSEDGITHNVWKVAGKEQIETIRDTFANMDAIYIADGHHRAASAVKVGLKRRQEHPDYDGTEEFNYFLSVLFPDEELKILPYNRVVSDLHGYEADAFLEKLREQFDITVSNQPVAPDRKADFGMYLFGQWYRLTAKDALLSSDPVKGLDVSILQEHILEPLLGIHDPRTNSRIDFVGGIRGLEELERRCREDMKLAFSMYPTSIAELFAVADAGRLMPPKSTWFEPKLRSGIFIHSI